MKFLESLIIGIVSGITEFLPISSVAHRVLIETMFGSDIVDPARNLFIHIAILLAVYASTAKKREHLAKAYRNYVEHRHRMRSNSNAAMEYQLLRLAAIPFLIIFFLCYYLLPIGTSLLSVSFGLLVNGILVYLPDRTMQGNKNAKVMTTFSIIIVGVAGALSAFPGFSRIALMISAAMLLGADKKASANWALLLSISALVALIVTDVFALFTGNSVHIWSNVLFYMITAIFAYIGAQVGIYILRKYISKNGCTSYAYYCWGAALFSLILFLTVV